MADGRTGPSRASVDDVLAAKIRRARYAILFERVWRRLWLAIAVATAFVAVSFAGLWPLLGKTLHLAVFLLFAGAFAAALIHACRPLPPSRDEALRRLETKSGVPHRPASSYEDTLTAHSQDPATQAIWKAHRERLAASLAKLKVGRVSPRTHDRDPWALRALGLFGVLLGGLLLGDSAADRLRSAFRFGPPALASDARLDAWVTPPAYTGKAPMLLADGQRPGVSLARDDGKPFEVPERSVLVVRASGPGLMSLHATFKPDAGAPTELAGLPIHGAAGVLELKTELRASGTVTVAGGPKPWVFAVTPDLAPKIALTKEPEANPRGSMKLSYKVEDDYGVVAAEARFKKLPEAAGDEKTAWARTDLLKGPRLPLERPPKYALRLPQVPNAPAGGPNKPGEAMTYVELGGHPWAGLKVEMTLEAKDAAGQTGKSTPKAMVLPARRFTKPLARAVVEQRRKLVADSRSRAVVVRGLEALMIAPDKFIAEPQVYLGLRTATNRLMRDKTRAGIKSVVEQLWHVALRIEDGNLSDAERRLKDAQDKLAKALDDGASEEEIERLMKELRQAMNDYIEQLAKQNEGQEQDQAGQDADRQELGQNDLERMMRQMEQAAKNGAKEQAQQMLSEMRDLMDRLQAQKGDRENRDAQRQMQKKMDELGNMIGQQQKLMDDTFGEMKRQADKGAQGQQQKPGAKGQPQKGQQPGDKGQGQAQGKGQRGSRGQGQPSGEPGAGEAGESAENGEAGQNTGEGLRQRQRQLADQLDKLKSELKRGGAGGSKEMNDAAEAMEEAEQALKDGQLDEATQSQADALDKMRKGAQQMQQEMAKNGRSRYGENGEAPRDPLGRPQKSQGPDAGTSVKVPSEIDVQRAREILEELRKRSAEQTRPPVELDYLERLLKRF